eukprot:12861602-Heterocapsa_arctica.AAC.1
MVMGRVRRDLGFRQCPGGLSRLPRSCRSTERQMRERGSYAVGRERSRGFRCKSGEKEREQKAKRSTT